MSSRLSFAGPTPRMNPPSGANVGSSAEKTVGVSRSELLDPTARVNGWPRSPGATESMRMMSSAGDQTQPDHRPRGGVAEALHQHTLTGDDLHDVAELSLRDRDPVRPARRARAARRAWEAPSPGVPTAR